MAATKVEFSGLVPHLRYEDAGAALDWLSSICGFEERSRYVDNDGIVRQAEMRVGTCELWLGGVGPGLWEKEGPNSTWIGVWVDDVDAQHARVIAAGAEADPPVDKDYDVRTFVVKDPEGYSWGFMKRLGTGYVQKIATEDGGLEEILPTGSGS